MNLCYIPNTGTRKYFKRRRQETDKFAEIFNLEPEKTAAEKRRQAEWLKPKRGGSSRNSMQGGIIRKI